MPAFAFGILATTLALFGASNSTYSPYPVSSAKDELACVACERVVSYMVDLASHGAEAPLMKALERVCDELPQAKEECIVDVKRYVPLAIDVLKHTSPIALCTRIGACTS